MSEQLKPIVIDPKIRELADDLKANHTVDDDNRISFPGAEELFGTKLQPLTELITSQKNLLTMSSAVSLATGELSQERMVANKDISRTTSRVNLGVGRIESAHDRRVSGTAAGKEWNKYGRTTCDITVGTGAATREYRNVVEHLAREGEKVFSN